MKKFIFGLIIGLIISSGIARATKIASPPPIADSSLQHYLYEIRNNIHSPEVTTTAPNNSRRANEGKLVIYNNSGTYELWVKTNVDATDWQKIGP